jgi:hypothetical protein
MVGVLITLKKRCYVVPPTRCCNVDDWQMLSRCRPCSPIRMPERTIQLGETCLPFRLSKPVTEGIAANGSCRI